MVSSTVAHGIDLQRLKEKLKLGITLSQIVHRIASHGFQLRSKHSQTPTASNTFCTVCKFMCKFGDPALIFSVSGFNCLAYLYSPSGTCSDFYAVNKIIFGTVWTAVEGTGIVQSHKHPPTPSSSLNLGTFSQHQSLFRQYQELISSPEPTAHQFPILLIGALVLAKCPPNLKTKGGGGGGDAFDSIYSRCITLWVVLTG